MANNLQQAKTTNDAIKLEKSKLQLQRLNDRVLDRQQATETIAQLIQDDRTQWRIWLTQQHELIANRLSVNPSLLKTELFQAFEEQQHSLSPIDLQFEPDRDPV